MTSTGGPWRRSALCAMLCVASIAARGAEPGLVVWYAMDESRTAQIVKDRSGNDNHGDREGGRWVSGRIGGAYECGGSGFINVPVEGLEGVRERVTVACWAKSGGHGPNYLFDARSYDSGHNYWNVVTAQVPNKDGAVEFSTGLFGEREFVAGRSDAATDGAWHHYAFTKDAPAGVMKAYVDGRLLAVQRGRSRPLYSFGMFRIGRERATNSQHFFDGAVDDFRIYDRVLSATEVTNLYEGYGGYVPPRGRGSYYLRPRDTVLVMGDATTLDGGYMRRVEEATRREYPGLAGEARVVFVNAGAPGATARAGLASARELLARHRPTVAVLCYGASDAIHETPDFASSMKSLIETMRDAAVDVTVLTPLSFYTRGRPELERAASSLATRMGRLRALVRELDVPLADAFERTADASEDYSWGDGVHPDDAGRQIMADALRAAWSFGEPLFDPAAR